MKREVVKAVGWGLFFTAILALLIIVGSRNLSRFDAALVAYTFASLFAVFGITYRYAMWLQRPPTALYWRRGWQVFFRRSHFAANFCSWIERVTNDFALNRFIWKRDPLRGLAHSLIMWGCIISLVFGWASFESLPDQLQRYRAVVFGFPTISFSSESWFGFLVFHGLVWAALLVIPGVMLAMRRRMRDEGAAAVQLFAEDFLPLVLLFAISVTGLLLTGSAEPLKSRRSL